MRFDGGWAKRLGFRLSSYTDAVSRGAFLPRLHEGASRMEEHNCTVYESTIPTVFVAASSQKVEFPIRIDLLVSAAAPSAQP